MAPELVSGKESPKTLVAIHRAEAACADLRASLSPDRTIPVELCEDLHAAIEMAATRSARSMEELRVAVERFTIALRDDGARPEAVLIALKSVINSRTFPVSEYEGEAGAERLRQQISTWSILEFYRDKQA